MKAWYGGDAVDDDKIGPPWCVGPMPPPASPLPPMDNATCALAAAWLATNRRGSAPMGVIGICGDWKGEGKRWWTSDEDNDGSAERVQCACGECKFPGDDIARAATREPVRGGATRGGAEDVG